MGLVTWLAQNPGLASLTLVAALLAVYLLYVMIHPERF